MLEVSDKGVIKLTRGDTARLIMSVTKEILSDSDELVKEDYTIRDTDTLELHVKKSVKDSEVSFKKTITGSNMFHIEPSDTKNLSFGKYVYDIELTTEEGDVYTVVIPTTFEVLQEVN